MKIEADLGIDEFEALKWALAEMRGNCTSIYSVDPDKAIEVFDSLAKKVGVFHEAPYRAGIRRAAEIGSAEEAESTPLLGQRPPWGLLKGEHSVNPDIHFVDDGSMLLEWGGQEWRFYIAVEEDPVGCTWGIVSKLEAGGLSEYGPLAEHVSRALWALNEVLRMQRKIKQ
jgi:hypothetical protein